MKKITIAYWHGTKLDNIKYNHMQELPCITTTDLTPVIQHILSNGANVMILHTGNGFIVHIDKGSFKQR